jgi:ABC-type amino acid transport system permease subunit
MGEVVRSGIASIPKGQWEAAASLGLPYYRIMRHILLPQALRVMIPPTIGVYVSKIKESSLASVIGFVDFWVREWRFAGRIPCTTRPMCWLPSPAAIS